MATEVVRVENLDKHFGALEVLRNVSLSVTKGEVVVLFGRSGSGKSTLLRCINFLEEPTAGIIDVGGVRMEVGPALRARREQINQIRRRCGMVFQEFNLFPHLSVLENVIEAPCTVKGESRKVASDRARELLARVGLEEKADEYPIRLSGGQKQRVAIARALAMQPDIMLFDEPTSALDPELIGEVLSAMRDLAKDGMTMVVVTHEMGFAREVANRMVFMHEGELIEDGPPSRVINSPSDERTRRFLEAVL
ncbi:MAG: amino acid ABC transporter ATP-binding protein [Actinomycetota bacterium]